MKPLLIIITLGVTLLASRAGAATIISRHSLIHGEGIGISNQTAETTDFFADFNQTLSASGQNGYVEQYIVSQHSAVGVDGFSLQTTSSGSVISGNFASLSTQTFFDVIFYVTEPSLITITVNYPHPLGGGDVGVGFIFKSITRDGGQVTGNGDTFFSFGSGQVPGSFVFSTPLSADPNVGYEMHLDDGDSVDAFGQKPRLYSFSGQFTATISAVPEPTTTTLVGFGLVLMLLCPRFARFNGRKCA